MLKKENYINVTPHEVTLQTKEGEVFTVAPSGTVINARPTEVSAGIHPSGVELVRTIFVADQAGKDALDNIYAETPDAVVLGSIIAAQAYPGRVLSMVPVPGFVRVPPDQKRMRADKFTTF